MPYGYYNLGSLHSNYTGGPGNPSNPILTITQTSSGNWTLYEKTKNGYIICDLSGYSSGMGIIKILLSATTSTAGVEYNLNFI